MRDKGKLYTLALAIMLGIGLIGFGVFLGWKISSEKNKSAATALSLHDTIIICKTDTCIVKDYDTIVENLVRYKQICIHDTAFVFANDTIKIPITQKHYHKDSICDIWVSGYEPRLDSANIIQKERVVIENHYLPVSEYKNSIVVIGGINNCALMYQRNIGRRFQVGGYVGSDYSGKTQAGINAGIRF